MLAALTWTLLTFSPSPSARLLDEPTLLAQSHFFPPAPANPRVAALEAEIFSLNQDLNQLKSFWPIGTMAMCIAGGILSPLALVGLVTLFIPFFGLPLLVLGAGGVALLVVGLMNGFTHDEVTKRRRAELLERRGELERELREARGQALGPAARPFLVTVAAF
jgi:hypothetical protein